METPTRHHVDILCQRLRRIGVEGYTRADDGFYDVRLNAGGEERTPELRELYNSQTKGWKSLEARVEQDLRSSGFESFSNFFRGHGTVVFTGFHGNGHHYPVRISLKHAEQRIVSPLVAQAYYEHKQPGSVTDVTAMMQMISVSDGCVPKVQNVLRLDEEHIEAREALELVLDSVLSQFMRAASCTLATDTSLSEDVAVLPDGTPIQVDPGQLKYIDPMSSETSYVRAAIQRFFMIMKANSLPEQLRWFEADGNWKQDRFFKNPFLRTTYYQGFRPTS